MLLMAPNLGKRELDIEGFYRWAMGNLVSNLNRGTFAEWLVGKALGVISENDVRDEWDAYDLLYRRKKVEVKASGADQAFSARKRSKPRFDIAPRQWKWEASAGDWVKLEPPARVAEVYVFCLHEPVPATNENVRDPESWKFWVISRKTLDDELGAQKSVGVATLNRLGAPVGWLEIRDAVDRSVGVNN